MHRFGVLLLAVCVWVASTAAIPSVTYAQDDVAAAQASEDKEEGIERRFVFHVGREIFWADWIVHSWAFDLFHCHGDPPIHGFPTGAGRAARGCGAGQRPDRRSATSAACTTTSARKARS